MKASNPSEFIMVKELIHWESGGGIQLDLVELIDGRVIALSEDVVVLYDSMDDLVSGDSRNRPSILL